MRIMESIHAAGNIGNSTPNSIVLNNGIIRYKGTNSIKTDGMKTLNDVYNDELKWSI